MTTGTLAALAVTVNSIAHKIPKPIKLFTRRARIDMWTVFGPGINLMQHRMNIFHGIGRGKITLSDLFIGVKTNECHDQSRDTHYDQDQ